MDVRNVSATATGEVCRLVIVAPGGRQAETVVPAGVPLCDLMPALLRQAGPALADAGLEHGGWILQRLGEAPLEEDRTPAALGLRDGDVLTFRPRDDALPEMDFDDLVDGISTGIRARPDRWHEEMTRRLLLGFMLTALVGAWLTLLPAGPAAPRAAVAATVAALLTAAAGTVSRTVKDTAVGTALAAVALPYAALGGALAAARHNTTLPLPADQLFPASLAVLATAMTAVLLAPSARPLFAGATAVATAGALISAPPIAAALGPAQAAAVLLSAALLLGPSIPVLSFRLARLRTPALPTGADDLGEDIDPVPAGPLLNQVARTDLFMTALSTALGAICALCLVPLAAAPGWAPTALALVACTVLLLRSRVLLSAWQRMAMIVPAVLGLLVLAFHCAQALSFQQRLAFEVGALLAFAACLLAASRALPGRRVLPYWGRAADLAETLTALGLIPLVFQVLGLYAYVRGLTG